MKLLTLLTLSFFFLHPSYTFATNWKINRDHSEIFFEIPYLQVSEITGRFNEYDGHVSFSDKGNLPDEISIKVKTASLDSGNRQRDGHLKSQDFLKAQTHPEITFTSQMITHVGGEKYRAQGVLSVAGVANPFVIDFTMTPAVKDTWNFENRFVKFRSEFSRKDFRIVWNKTLADNKYLVGDMITIWGTFQLQPAGVKTPTSKHMIPDTAYIRDREKLNRGEEVQPTNVIPLPSPMVTHHKSPIVVTRATDSTISSRKDNRGTGTWWMSLGVLGLFGFLGSIMFGIYTKKMVSDKYPAKYRESSLLGLLTDAVAVFIILIYAVAFWELGWG
ncbi:MAG: YceI family protein [Bdellovibrionota bacterium]